MRTTIEMSEAHRAIFVRLAAERGEKGLPRTPSSGRSPPSSFHLPRPRRPCPPISGVPPPRVNHRHSHPPRGSPSGARAASSRSSSSGEASRSVRPAREADHTHDTARGRRARGSRAARRHARRAGAMARRYDRPAAVAPEVRRPRLSRLPVRHAVRRDERLLAGGYRARRRPQQERSSEPPLLHPLP